jgi:U3 small nucleolar RNA-associated protein 14
MPGRQSHGTAPFKAPKLRNKSKKRALDAFSIASHQNPDNVKIRQSRLGTSEGGNRPGKRQRDADDDEDGDEEEQDTKKQRKGPPKGRLDELDVDRGSDSEGNEWLMGEVDMDDDSELDSDEAFGESDEERFDGFAFSGSTDKKTKKTKSRPRDVNLDEADSEEDSDSELEEGDLGEGAIDLAAMLDDKSDDEEEVPPKKKPQKGRPGKDDGENEQSIWDTECSESMDDNEDSAVHSQQDGGDSSSEIDEIDEDHSSEDDSMSSAGENEDDTANPAKIAALHDIITRLPQSEQSFNGRSKKLIVDDFNPASKGTLALEDFALAGNASNLSGAKLNSKRKTKALDVPLAKRQQDRLDRSAAYEKSKETLKRWNDTVKHNRRADHLMFPLPDNDVASAKSNSILMPTTTSKPFNELEATIQSILEESGLADKDGKDGEDAIREFEELETNKMSLEEVSQRRQQLRMARELMFREEAKAKRIKKIKSRSFRRVHRKDREKEDQLNKKALAEGGFEPSEDELEAQDRRRATERMGQKHRGSKWAKATKETGRAAWDENARAGITEMARRDEALRRRVEGRAVRKEFDDESEISATESDDDISEDDEFSEEKSLLKKLKSLASNDAKEDSGPGSKLANMPFMRKAAALKRKENDELVEVMRREIAGEDSPSEDEDVDVGRRVFGPESSKHQNKSNATNGNDFEEPTGSGDEEEFNGFDKSSSPSGSQAPKKKPAKITKPLQQENASEGGAWSKVTTNSGPVNDAEAKRRRHKSNNATEGEELDLSKAIVMASQVKPKAKPKKISNKSTILDVSSDEDSNDENTTQLPFALRDHDIIKRAFAGADVVDEFEAEKRQTIEDEEDKIVDETLPGWGNWVGDGLSKKEKARNKGRKLKTVEGIKEKNRKDAKLQSVIINEKRVKKVSKTTYHIRSNLFTNSYQNTKYLASSLPHPFETRQQYERSLRLPVGPEWSTKQTFQSATKPRILLKQGIIAPMSKPLL